MGMFTESALKSTVIHTVLCGKFNPQNQVFLTLLSVEEMAIHILKMHVQLTVTLDPK